MMIDFKNLTENQKEWLIDALQNDATEHIEAARNENIWSKGSLADNDIEQAEMHIANLTEHTEYVEFLIDLIRVIGGDPDEALDR